MSINTTPTSVGAQLQPTSFAQQTLAAILRTSTLERWFKPCDGVVAKTFAVLLLLLLSGSYIKAQTPTYSLTGGTGANSWPFNAASTGSNKCQWLYYPSNFPTAPAGVITTVYFRTNTSGSRTITDLTIKMGSTSLSTFTSGTFQTGLTTVFSGTTTITIPTNGWMAVTLSSPYYYNATSNFIVEASHNGSTTGISVMLNHSTPNGRIFGNLASTTGTNGTGLTDFGMDILPGPPCTAPSMLPTSNRSSTRATLNWGPVTPSVGYTYVLSTSPNPPTTGFSNTTATSFTATGLTPSTTYYFYLRNNCAANNWSMWVRDSFRTNPPCGKRNIKVMDVTTSTAKIKWNKEAYGPMYEYLVKNDTSQPTTGTTSTTDSMVTIQDLQEGTKYYVLVRMLCDGGESSPWALDSFTTRTVCRPPTLNVTNIDASRAIVYWDPMPTAVEYEYEVSQSPTALGKGTSIQGNSFLAFPLKDGQVYYFHVKCKCVDQGFKSESDWTSTSFKTWPTSVANATGNAFMITAYPNPMKDQLTINITGTVPGDAQITIMDVNGRIAEKVKVTDAITNINTSKLPAGIYLLKYSDAQYSEVLKITKE